MGDSNYVDFRTETACRCIAEWYPVYEQMAWHRGILPYGTKIWLIQATGGAVASAGTHSQGGAMDTGQVRHDLVKLAREMGASASWVRNTGSFRNNQHSHLVLNGCPHNAPARYQITAVKAGYNGLGYQGRGGYDDEWRPSYWRTWTEGLAWAREQLIPREQREDWSDMATKDEIKQAMREVLTEPVIAGEAGVPGTSWRNNMLWLHNSVSRLLSVTVGQGLKRANVGGPTDLATEAAWNAENFRGLTEAIERLTPADPTPEA